MPWNAGADRKPCDKRAGSKIQVPQSSSDAGQYGARMGGDALRRLGRVNGMALNERRPRIPIWSARRQRYRGGVSQDREADYSLPGNSLPDGVAGSLQPGVCQIADGGGPWFQ